MSTSSTWRSRTSTTPAPRRGAHRPTEFCEPFHKTVLDEFYRIAFRKRIYATIEQLQGDLDAWMTEYNQARPHQGRWCYGKTPMQTFLDTRPIAKEKSIRAA
jgi:Integrase core domain